MRDFLSIADLSADELVNLLERSAKIKADPQSVATALAGTAVAMLFEKPSTRTRTSFEVAVGQMAGIAVILTETDMQLGRGESLEDTGRVLSRYAEAIVLRTFGQDRLDRLAGAADAPVVSALSDLEHPCQAVGDLLTITERKGALAGLTLAYLGDGNNTCHALMLAGALSGMRIRVACPPGYEPDERVSALAAELAAAHGGAIEVTDDPAAGPAGADIVYTDVWASMGQESEATAREAVFPPFQVNAAAMALAAPDAIAMHCLPAHRGLEITDEVLDGPQSVVWDQAENRLHTEKAILLFALDR
ncbi:MAG: ornithine carbamoyltransferase [Actinomycetota bacterium]